MRIPIHILGSTVLVVLAALCLVWSGAGQAQETAPRAPPTERLCRVCHADRFASTATSPHTVLDSEAWQARTGRPLSCLSCHGDVTEHIAAGGQAEVFAFADEPARNQSEVCLSCHSDDHPGFDSSPHALAGVTCADCHSQHDAARESATALRRTEQRLVDEMGWPSALCGSCHTEKLAEFALNERHSLDAVECTSCHNPHAPANRRTLGGFRHEVCTQCHADKGGPFVFEHPASRVEGCTACHSPHGSPNRHLLTHQRTGELCISCHATLPQFHLGFAPVGPPRFSLDTQCTNCHSAIHGSNFDPAFLQ